MKWRSLALAALAGTALTGAFASCSLGLDESLIGRADSAPLPTGTGEPPESSVPDVVRPTEAGIDGSAVGSCTVDADCKAASGCLKGKCESGTCAYAICPQADPCRAARCDVAADACLPPLPLPRTEEIRLVDNIAVSGPLRSVAVIPPFAFVSTSSGVYAYLYQEPGLPKTILSVSGAPFVPSYMFASGRRLYMLGGLTGSLQRRLPVAWLDVPQNPAAELKAESRLVSYNGQAFNVALPTAGEKLLLGHTSPGYAFAVAEPPFAGTIGLNTVATAQSYQMIATSGADRVVAIRQLGGVGAPAFSILTGAGSASGVFGVDQGISPGPQYSYNFGNGQFAASAKGAVATLWPLNLTTAPYNGSVSAVRLAFILDDDKDTSFAGDKFIDVVTYPPPGSPNYQNMAGPIAFADDQTVFATFATPSTPTTKLSAAFYTLSGGADAGAGDAGVGQATELALQPGNVYGAAAAPGVGVVTGYNGTIGAAVMHVVRPACAP